MAESTPQAWLIVGSRDNFEMSRELGLRLQGIKARYGKKAALIRPGDKLVYYLTGLMVIAGIATVTSEATYDETRIWPCTNPKETYPHRVTIEPDTIPDGPNGFLPVKPFVPALDYLKKWPEKNWTLGFQGNIHQWPWADYLQVRQAFDAHQATLMTSAST